MLHTCHEAVLIQQVYWLHETIQLISECMEKRDVSATLYQTWSVHIISSNHPLPARATLKISTFIYAFMSFPLVNAHLVMQGLLANLKSNVISILELPYCHSLLGGGGGWAAGVEVVVAFWFQGLLTGDLLSSHLRTRPQHLHRQPVA